MVNCINIVAIVEGKTEQIFIEDILAPYLAHKNLLICATQISKPGQKGGDVHFCRAKRDINAHLKQRNDTYVTTFMDYYGIKEWPGLDLIPPQANSKQIANIINEATRAELQSLFPNHQTNRRFIPFIAVHEFEAFLFSDTKILAKQLEINESEISRIISKYGSPEAINNSPQTAPSKRLDAWSPNRKFKKTLTGITIAKEIGIDKIRNECPLFDKWVTTFEEIKRNT